MDNDLDQFSYPLLSGFNWRLAREEETRLSKEALARVFEKMASVDEARRKAMADSRNTCIG